MEQQAQPHTAGPVARGHNVVHVVAADWSVAPAVLNSVIERIDPTAATVQLLVLAADADAAVGIGRALTMARGGVPPRVLAATGAGRAARIIRAGAAAIVVGAPNEILGLLRASALKLEGLRAVAIGWLDDILDAGGGADLEAVMAEVGRDVPRVVITATVGAPVEDFVERYAWRAPRLAAPGGGSVPDATAARPDASARAEMPVEYVLVTPPARPVALRQVLDEVDPPSATISVRSEESELTVRDTLLTLGYHDDHGPVRVVRGPVGEHGALLVLYDLPLDPTEVRAATAGSPARTVALLLPRQLPHLRGLVAGSVTPFVSATPAAAARAREEALRLELGRELAAGTPMREVLALEPLLAQHNGIDLAAAALRLLERERWARAAAARVVPPPTLGDRPRPGRPDDRARTPMDATRGASFDRRQSRPTHGGDDRDGRPGRGPRGGGTSRPDHARRPREDSDRGSRGGSPRGDGPRHGGGRAGGSRSADRGAVRRGPPRDRPPRAPAPRPPAETTPGTGGDGPSSV